MRLKYNYTESADCFCKMMHLDIKKKKEDSAFQKILFALSSLKMRDDMNQSFPASSFKNMKCLSNEAMPVAPGSTWPTDFKTSKTAMWQPDPQVKNYSTIASWKWIQGPGNGITAYMLEKGGHRMPCRAPSRLQISLHLTDQRIREN